MDRPWLRHYPPGVPGEIDVARYPSLVAMFEEGFKKYAGRKACACMMERVTSGEHLIAYGIFGSYALGRSKKDANLGIILPKDYTMVTSRVAFVSKHAKNPNAGKLFLDYILSKRGQEIIANKADLYSLRSDVDGEATIKGVTQLIGDKARPVPIDQTLLENLDQAKRLAFLSKWQQAKKGQ